MRRTGGNHHALNERPLEACVSKTSRGDSDFDPRDNDPAIIRAAREETGRRRRVQASGQMEGSGTVFGRSMVWPNQVFWILAISPLASTLRIAALMASISVLSSSRPTQEK